MAVHFPPEWSPQKAVLLAWPYPGSDWSPWLEAVEEAYLALSRAILERSGLIVLSRHPHIIQRRLGVETYPIPYHDTWIRDYGPLTVSENGHPALIDFRFDGWGRKYPFALDDQVTRRLQALGAFGNCPLRSIDWVLEGGSIDTDGKGTLLTTPCLEKRHPGLSRKAIEERLKAHLGVDRVLWVEGAIPGDDTDGHIDTLARFCSADTLVYIEAPCLRPLEAALRGFKDPKGQPYRLIPLPLPDIRDPRGRPLPASYANFLILNGAVIAPTYRHPLDGEALDRLKEAFPNHDIVPLDAFPFIHQYGSIHCLTMATPCAS